MQSEILISGQLGQVIGNWFEVTFTNVGSIVLCVLLLLLSIWLLEIENNIITGVNYLLRQYPKLARVRQALFSIQDFQKQLKDKMIIFISRFKNRKPNQPVETDAPTHDTSSRTWSDDFNIVKSSEHSENPKDSADSINFKPVSQSAIDENNAMDLLGTGRSSLDKKVQGSEQLTRLIAENKKPQPTLIRAWKLPSLKILDSADEETGKGEDQYIDVRQQIIQTLKSFNVSGQVVGVNPGPSVTQYEVQPAAGVKISQFVSLANDLALALQCGQVRVVAPIPGKAVVGIEVPNRKSQKVKLKNMLSSDSFKDLNKKLWVGLGKDISGQPVFCNLKEMPHLLIAGATGSGKSICINTLIASLIFHLTPDEVRLVLIDPKRVELTLYKNLPHLALPVICDPREASLSLKWVVKEMEERYSRLAELGVRDIDGYNEKIDRNKEDDISSHRMYYIVVLIDELADLMMTARDRVEEEITRLAQMSRAVGIHLVLATQRPTTEIITGTIKANFPSRIAFQVFSKVDSRTILDMNGAENLLGRGDMLYLPVGFSKPLRLQGSYVTLEELERLVQFWKNQGTASYVADLAEELPDTNVGLSKSSDELYEEAVRIVLESRQASASFLQRKLKIGYSRAARLLDEMEQQGLIAHAEGNKPRRIFGDAETWESVQNPNDSFPLTEEENKYEK